MQQTYFFRKRFCFILCQEIANFNTKKDEVVMKTLMRAVSTPSRGADISVWRGGGLFISLWAFGDAFDKISRQCPTPSCINTVLPNSWTSGGTQKTMHMRKTLLSLMLLLALSVTAATPKSVVIHTADGGTKAYSISGIRKITFDSTKDGSLKIYPKNGLIAYTYSYTNMQKGVFSSQSGIEELVEAETDLNIIYNSGTQTVNILSSNAIDDVQVYDVRGRLVLVANPGDTTAEISISGLSKGLYIVKAVSAGSVVTEKIVKY